MREVMPDLENLRKRTRDVGRRTGQRNVTFILWDQTKVIGKNMFVTFWLAVVVSRRRLSLFCFQFFLSEGFR